MFPAPMQLCSKLIINNIRDIHYKNLVRAEYRIIKQKTQLILQNAKAVYEHIMKNDGNSKLSQRCNDFKLLEEKCKEYIRPQVVNTNSKKNTTLPAVFLRASAL